MHGWRFFQKTSNAGWLSWIIKLWKWSIFKHWNYFFLVFKRIEKNYYNFRPLGSKWTFWATSPQSFDLWWKNTNLTPSNVATIHDGASKVLHLSKVSLKQRRHVQIEVFIIDENVFHVGLNSIFVHEILKEVGHRLVGDVPANHHVPVRKTF